MKTRVKLYVSAINTTYVNETMNKSVIHLNAAYSPDPTSENYTFWKATPSGTFRFHRHGNHDFLPGEKYYVDITPNEQGNVGLISKEIFDTSVKVVLASPNNKMIGDVRHWDVDCENFEINITNEKAWDVFENDKFSIQIIKI